ncbi:hypothetical protein Kisp02_23760 [Kineosporia sp. NBRC 101731]|nr:hypothetical protein Kisp02_23760 [Kineosporia sp. NBRC 101731]
MPVGRGPVFRWSRTTRASGAVLAPNGPWVCPTWRRSGLKALSLDVQTSSCEAITGSSAGLVRPGSGGLETPAPGSGERLNLRIFARPGGLGESQVFGAEGVELESGRRLDLPALLPEHTILTGN